METQDIRITSDSRVLYEVRVLEIVEMQTTHKPPLTSEHDLEILIRCKVKDIELHR
jgi:hypothetical protein